MAARYDMPIEELRQLLRLDPETGKLYWLPRGVDRFRDDRLRAASRCAWWNGRFAGTAALGAMHKDGYRHGSIFRRLYLAHRIVFALANGRWPTGQVDHRDGDRLNNVPDNLRDATNQENQRNRGSVGGTSQFCGVYWRQREGTWCARCADASGKKRHLGRFTDEREAARAYDRAATAWHGEFARLNFPDLPAEPEWTH